MCECERSSVSARVCAWGEDADEEEMRMSEDKQFQTEPSHGGEE